MIGLQCQDCEGEGCGACARGGSGLQKCQWDGCPEVAVHDGFMLTCEAHIENADEEKAWYDNHERRIDALTRN